MPELDPCEICLAEAETVPSGGSDFIHQRCRKCGDVKFTVTAASMWRSKRSPETTRRLQGYIRDQNRSGAVPLIGSDTLRQILQRPLPSVMERAERLLLEALGGQTRLGLVFNCHEPRFAAATYSLDAKEVAFLVKLLNERGLMRLYNDEINAEVLPGGYVYADELLRGPNVSTSVGFVAMWFDPSLDSVYADGFAPGITNAGYEALRVDQVEHVGRIDDEIIASIRSSRFVVADFTGHRGGVYFEAGYAMGMGLPVFWTCRRDNIGELHFDIRQYNCIDWTTSEELARRLEYRIAAVLGRGPR